MAVQVLVAAVIGVGLTFKRGLFAAFSRIFRRRSGSGGSRR